MIGAGAGLSTSAGFTYTGERFERYFSDFYKKYGFTDMYSGGFYPYETLEEYWAYWSRYIYINRYMDPPKPVYDRLYEKYYSVKVVQSMEIKRKKDGSIEGITTMGDSVKEKFTDEEKKRQEMKRKYDKKYAVGTVK